MFVLRDLTGNYGSQKIRLFVMDLIMTRQEKANPRGSNSDTIALAALLHGLLTYCPSPTHGVCVSTMV
jgi:hypothetical protein